MANNSLESGPALCSECESLQLNRLAAELQPFHFNLQGPKERPRPQLLATLSWISEESRSSSCPLCRFFADTLHRLIQVDCHFSFTGIKLWRSWYGLYEHVCGDVFLLATDLENITHHAGFVYSVSPKLKQPPLFNHLEPTANLRHVCEWIEQCEDNHSDCRAEPSSLTNLRVIDCRSRSIVTLAKGASYTTLSYVWGVGAHEAADAAESLPAALPPLIEDAILVTQGLGHHFLWVDRYCIPQEDGEIRNEHVKRMDEIYRGSMITIVSLGADPSHRLPGLRTTRRTQLAQISLGGWDFYNVYPPGREVEKSKWATRGWTLQEGMLSRRILYFTDHYMAFECRQKCKDDIVRDELAFELNKFPDQYTSYAKPSKHPWPSFRKEITYEPGLEIGGLWNVISSYNMRDLTRSEDALDAIQGVLNIWKRHGRLRSYWAQPFQVDAHEHWPTSLGFLQSLTWHAQSYLGTRRPGFPSWSWLGWAKSEISPDWPDVVQAYLWIDQIENPSLPADNFLVQGQHAVPLGKLRHGIHFIAWTTTVQVTREEYSCDESFDLSDGDSAFAAEKIEQDGVDCLVVPEQEGDELWGASASDIVPEYVDADHVMYAFLVTAPVRGTSYLDTRTAVIINGSGVQDITLEEQSKPETLSWPEDTEYSERIGSVILGSDQYESAKWQRRLVHLR